jgi:hypothetical protein
VLNTVWAGLDQFNPVGHVFMRGMGDAPGSAPGWPSSRRIEELRQQWLDAPDAAGGDAVRENGECWARMMSRLRFVSDINRTDASFSVVYLCPFVFICGSIPM